MSFKKESKPAHAAVPPYQVTVNPGGSFTPDLENNVNTGDVITFTNATGSQTTLGIPAGLSDTSSLPLDPSGPGSVGSITVTAADDGSRYKVTDDSMPKLPGDSMHLTIKMGGGNGEKPHPRHK